jgi:hypothetical protein
MANSSVQNTIIRRYELANINLGGRNEKNNYYIFHPTDKTQRSSLALDINHSRVSVQYFIDIRTDNKFTLRYFDSEKATDVLRGSTKTIEGNKYFNFDYNKISHIETIINPIDVDHIQLIIYTKTGKVFQFVCEDRIKRIANSSPPHKYKETYIAAIQTSDKRSEPDNAYLFQNIDPAKRSSLLLDVNYRRVTVKYTNDIHNHEKFQNKEFDAIKAKDILGGKFKQIDGITYFNFDYNLISHIEILINPRHVDNIYLTIYTLYGDKYEFVCEHRRISQRKVRIANDIPIGPDDVSQYKKIRAILLRNARALNKYKPTDFAY